MITGRVIEAHRTNFTVATLADEVVTATVRGNFHVEGEFPKVGDYVSLSLLGDSQAVIEDVLPRTSVIKRKSANGEGEQIIVANVDLVIIVMGLDGDFNANRLERYLLLAEQSNVPALVVLNKADVVADVSEYLELIKVMAGQTPVCTVSALTGTNMPAVAEYITPVTTAVLLGSSGAGKSTITNWFLNEQRQMVKTIREDDSHGRHTTTSRQLFALPQGGFLIDTPGMRELALLDSEEESEQLVFERIEKLALECQFNDCDHAKSAGCAVLKALAEGELTEREFKNYHKLLRERQFSNDKNMTTAQRHAEARKIRTLQKNAVIRKRKV